MQRKVQVFVEGLSAFRAADKLKGAGIPVLSVKKTQKSGVVLEVARKDLEKVFAILRGSCYNIKKIRFRGLARLCKTVVWRAGLAAGAILGIAAICFSETRILRVEYTGSGAYFAGEAEEILGRGGVKRYGAALKEYAEIEAEILALPRVSFCSLHSDGGILTVEIEVSDDNAVIFSHPLTASADGTLKELTVIRGAAVHSVGDSVAAGEQLVVGTDEKAIVIARAVIVSPFEREYTGSEAAARAQALLDCSTLKDISVVQTEQGWLVTGRAETEVSVNLG